VGQMGRRQCESKEKLSLLQGLFCFTFQVVNAVPSFSDSTDGNDTHMDNATLVIFELIVGWIVLKDNREQTVFGTNHVLVIYFFLS